LEPFDVKWLNSVRVARNKWNNLADGYNLANLAVSLGIQYKHHDALEDSITCGKIVVEASRILTTSHIGFKIGSLKHDIELNL
jgi:DNA polymerase-3 subunit epsilon